MEEDYYTPMKKGEVGFFSSSKKSKYNIENKVDFYRLQQSAHVTASTKRRADSLMNWRNYTSDSSFICVGELKVFLCY